MFKEFKLSEFVRINTNLLFLLLRNENVTTLKIVAKIEFYFLISIKLIN